MHLVDDVLRLILGRFLSPRWALIAARVCREWREAHQAARPAGGPAGPPLWKPGARDYVASRSLVEWARANGAPWSAEVVAAAARRGDFATLRWATEAGAPWSWRVCADAGLRGDLRVLRTARELGVPLTTSVCMYAAYAGRVSVLEWALAGGVPWDPTNVFLCATWGTQAGVLRWGVLTLGASIWCPACADRVTPCQTCCRFLWIIRLADAGRVEADLRAAGFPFGYPSAPSAFEWRPLRDECRVWKRANRPAPVGPAPAAPN
jgi:hypothetical protein